MACDTCRVDACRTQLFLGGRARLGLSARDDHASTGLTETFGDGPPDTAGATGDQGYPSVQTEELADIDMFASIHHAGTVGRRHRVDHCFGLPFVLMRVSEAHVNGHPGRRRRKEGGFVYYISSVMDGTAVNVHIVSSHHVPPQPITCPVLRHGR